jgi:hypothetical protein
MMALRRHSTRLSRVHEAAPDAGLTAGQRVMTIDGLPGRVLFAAASFAPGLTEYEVTLDGGLGHGTYTSGQLQLLPDGFRAAPPGRMLPAGVTAAIEADAELHTADLDYPEMGSVLVDRPDPGSVITIIGMRRHAGHFDDDYELTPGHDPRYQHLDFPEGLSARASATYGRPDDPRDEEYNGGPDDTGVDWAEPGQQQWSEEHLGPQEEAPPPPWAVPPVLARLAQIEEACQVLGPRSGHLYRHATTVNGTQVDDHGDAPEHGTVPRASDPNAYDERSTEGDGDPQWDDPVDAASKKEFNGATVGMYPEGMSAGGGPGLAIGPFTAAGSHPAHGREMTAAELAGHLHRDHGYGEDPGEMAALAPGELGSAHEEDHVNDLPEEGRKARWLSLTHDGRYPPHHFGEYFSGEVQPGEFPPGYDPAGDQEEPPGSHYPVRDALWDTWNRRASRVPWTGHEREQLHSWADVPTGTEGDFVPSGNFTGRHHPDALVAEAEQEGLRAEGVAQRPGTPGTPSTSPAGTSLVPGTPGRHDAVSNFLTSLVDLLGHGHDDDENSLEYGNDPALSGDDQPDNPAGQPGGAGNPRASGAGLSAAGPVPPGDVREWPLASAAVTETGPAFTQGRNDGKRGRALTPDTALGMVTAAAASGAFRFEFTATWHDVVAKARRIRAEGHVRITHASTGMVIGEVRGDHDTYESGIQRPPGKPQTIQHWACGCPWASFHQDKSLGARYSGRPCSHVMALQYEAQARGMFGKAVAPDEQAPAWSRGDVTVRSWPPYEGDPHKGHWQEYWLAPTGSLHHATPDEARDWNWTPEERDEWERTRGRLSSFDQLQPHEQASVAQYHQQMTEEGSAHPGSTPRDYLYDSRQEPRDDFLKRYMDADDEFTSQYGPGDWEAHHQETLAAHPIPSYPADGRWPLIVRDENPNYVDDGYHRLHSYMRDGATHIPTVRMHLADAPGDDHGPQCLYRHDGPCPGPGSQEHLGAYHDRPPGLRTELTENPEFNPSSGMGDESSTHVITGYLGSHVAGHLHFSKSDDGQAYHVGMLHAYPVPGGRPSGVASAMMNHLYDEVKGNGRWLDHGWRTTQGNKWWASYREPHPEVNIHHAHPDEGWKDYFSPRVVAEEAAGNFANSGGRGVHTRLTWRAMDYPDSEHEEQWTKHLGIEPDAPRAVTALLASGEDPGEVAALALLAGLRLTADQANAPWGSDSVAGHPPAKPYGATEAPNREQDPGSYGFLAAPDPENWGEIQDGSYLQSPLSSEAAHQVLAPGSPHPLPEHLNYPDVSGWHEDQEAFGYTDRASAAGPSTSITPRDPQGIRMEEARTGQVIDDHGHPVEHDPIDCWQHLDGSVSHDDGTSVTDGPVTAELHGEPEPALPSTTGDDLEATAAVDGTIGGGDAGTGQDDQSPAAVAGLGEFGAVQNRPDPYASVRDRFRASAGVSMGDLGRAEFPQAQQPSAVTQQPGMGSMDEELSPADPSIQTVGNQQWSGGGADSDEVDVPAGQPQGSMDDIVASFQRSAAARLYGNGSGGQGASSADIAGAARAYLSKTADVLPDAEAAELISEGRGQRARNLALLRLEGTHYEDEDDSLERRGLSLDDYDDDVISA